MAQELAAHKGTSSILSATIVELAEIADCKMGKTPPSHHLHDTSHPPAQREEASLSPASLFLASLLDRGLPCSQAPSKS